MTLHTRSLPATAAEMRSLEADRPFEERSVGLTDVRATTGEDGTIRAGGLAIVFDSPSVDMGGWVEVIKRGSLRKLLATKPDVRLLVNHDGLPLGRTVNGTLTLKETARGLEWDVEFPPTTLAADVAVLLDRGDLSQMSFRFRVAPGGATWTEVDEDGRERRDVTEISHLPEISIVTFPAYEASTAGLREAPDEDPTSRGDGDQEQHDTDAGREAPTDGDAGSRSSSTDTTGSADEGATAETAAAANRRLAEARSAMAARRLPRPHPTA